MLLTSQAPVTGSELRVCPLQSHCKHFPPPAFVVLCLLMFKSSVWSPYTYWNSCLTSLYSLISV